VTAFRLTSKAVEDLRSIGRFTQNRWGREQRNIYLRRLDGSFRTIARQPTIGAACDHIREGYRKYHVGRHFIFYRLVETHIQIVRILHERMDVEKHIV
jgi:toxin ParE1/3/4